MRFGRNFGLPPIPMELLGSGRFGERLTKDFKTVGWDKGCEWLLIGIASTPVERDQMISSATNGSRKLHVIQRNQMYGIYST